MVARSDQVITDFTSLSQTIHLLPMTPSKWTILLIVFAATVAWSYFETAAIMEPIGGMKGFHPLVLFAMPVSLVFTVLVLLVALDRKSFLLAGLSFLPIVALGSPLFYGYDLVIAGWSREINLRASENEVAIRSVDLSSAEFNEVPYKDDDRMVEVPGFQWTNSESMVAAKNGVFFGFAVNGVPHVYICPLRNGARGVAWITDTSELENNPSVKYERTGTGNWYIWTLSI